MDLPTTRGLRRPTRRLVRRAVGYALVAVVLNLVWSRFGAPHVRRAAGSSHALGLAHSHAGVDFAWGSILHRFENHPIAPRAPPPLPSRAPAPPSRRRHVRTLIVTAELAGLHKNGGIGSAYLELAKSLARHDSIRVAILVADLESSFSAAHVTALQKDLARLQIELFFAVQELRPFFPEGWTALASRRVYDFLRGHDGEYDIVHFAENSGIGYFSALAKHEGLILRSTRIVVGLHGAFFEWAEMLNKRYPSDRYTAEMGFFERRTAELADAVVSPSAYMLEYVQQHGWTLPAHAAVIPNVIAPLAPQTVTHQTSGTITELVFFGRLEERKGIRLFVDALEQLFVSDPPSVATTITAVTFLGKDVPDPTTLAGVSSLLRQALEVIQNRTALPFEFQFLKDYDRDDALDYLQQPHRLAVMPALADNSPTTVLECIGRSIRFIASDVGGVPELVHPADRAAVLFKPLAAPFAAKITAIVEASSTEFGYPSIRAAPETTAAPDAWFDLHRSLAATAFDPIPATPDPPPLVTLCITHYERPFLLPQLLDSIHSQMYPAIEVVLVDDGSKSPEAVQRLAILEREYFADPNWTMLRINNSYLGEARNRAAAVARGAFVLFLDDDDVLKPHAVQTLVDVATKTGVNVLSSWLDEFATDANPLTTTLELPNRRTYWFLGQSLATGMLWNSFGSGNIFVRKSVFDDIGGFSTYREVGGEDWELYVRLALAGHEQLVVPEELLYVRSDPSRYSMKFAMDAWDAGYRALVPLLNDKRTQELGLAHALMYAKSHYLEAPPSLPLADSRDDFQLVQNWNGWIYSFEPADVPPTLADEYLAVVSEDRWSNGFHGVGPVVSQHSQTPFVSTKGGRVAAVRSFRSPAKMDVSVHVSYSARHECGDGTRLSLLLRLDSGSPAVELAARKTLDVPRDDLREDVSLEQGSTLHIFSDPLATDECDEVEIRVTLTVVELASKAWSNLATQDRIAKQAEEQAAAYSPPTPISADVWAPIETQPADTTDTDDLVYHIALIFDEFRFPHARQLIQSAEHFITSRKVFYHIIAPLSLHPAVYTFFETLTSAFRLYDHADCYKHARAVLPFSDPDIHISAHCKMFLSEIVTYAERVLYLDTDVTIASDISRCYSEPERPRTLISLGVDMGDSCQLQPELCWPLGLHWRVPGGLACGNVPALTEAGDRELPGCAATGELEPIQANGGVILFELVRMRDWNFVDKYVRSVAFNFRIAGRPAHWGEQDFINSYIRLFPNDFEFLPCGCNFQWWGIRQAVKCGEQPVHIAHHWAFGIASRQPDKPLNKLFYHFFDNSTAPVPPVPLLSPSLEGAPNSSSLDVHNNANCPRQEQYDCTSTYHPMPYGQKVTVISRILSERFVADLVESIASQKYPNLEHLVSVRDASLLPASMTLRIDIPLLADLDAEHDELCAACGALAASDTDCLAAPLEPAARRAYFSCLCSTSDVSAEGMYELESLVTSSSWILYLDDRALFTSPDAVSHLMAQVDSEHELVVFRSNTTSGEQELDFRKKILPRSDLRGVGYLFHSSHLDLTNWDGTRCGAWRTFENLSNRLTIKWIDGVPVTGHPLQQRLRTTATAELGITVVVLESKAHPSWFPMFLDKFDQPHFHTLINQSIVLTLDSEDGMFGDDIPVLRPAPGSGLAEISALIHTPGVLLLSDSITLDKAALTALVNFWLDDPLRTVGPFTAPFLDEFALPFDTEEEDFNYMAEPDPVVGIQPFYQILPRTLLTASAHLRTLSALLSTASAPVHPSCHGMLLNAISTNSSGAAPLRVLLPDESFVDRIHDCRLRSYAEIVPGPQPGEFDELSNDAPEEPTYAQCLDRVEQLMGPKSEWLFLGDEVGVAGPLGAHHGVQNEEVDPERWKGSRRVERCIQL